jgi:hypothetical protein
MLMLTLLVIGRQVERESDDCFVAPVALHFAVCVSLAALL